MKMKAERGQKNTEMNKVRITFFFFFFSIFGKASSRHSRLLYADRQADN